jgi:ATP-dependent Lon protease
MGLTDMIVLETDVLKVIIDEYTCESGVRKLKEILFEMIGEINLEILENFDKEHKYPIYISIDDIKNKYFKDKHEISNKKIYHSSRVGFINGMWANVMGQGGIIPIQCNYFPSNEFLKLKLTGMQGDVMKESMNVALTMAWKLTSAETKSGIHENHKSNLSGIHIHCPEGAVPKDGPSAGAAITTAIYSLFNDRKIKNDYAITGEISLDGTITQIGGLDLKFLGGIKAGVKHFIYPKENEKDYQKFIEKYKDNSILEGVDFVSVERIEEVFDVIFE